jgi:hypothetical protein
MHRREILALSVAMTMWGTGLPGGAGRAAEVNQRPVGRHLDAAFGRRHHGRWN